MRSNRKIRHKRSETSPVQLGTKRSVNSEQIGTATIDIRTKFGSNDRNQEVGTVRNLSTHRARLK